MADNGGIKLFEHNETAYISAVKMLSETGKAAVIHPTGTGKSFIAFKLCEDNINKKICWLSPSEYIFKTQCENLAAVGSAVPDNIAFFTYAKLMLMTETELEEIKPDYIILDEFHRCGAEMWGKGVESLLKTYPDTPVLGLSATAIRYLDNRRDMSDELFDGNIASEMTLGEAIVRGILNPPKYVLSVFGYRKELEKYKQKIMKAKSKAVRAEGEKYLDALKRALEKADGLDVIFKKHIENKSGKYIVFCSNFDHMSEMADKAPEWFAKVDTDPHIYIAYSNDPATSKAFADFKADASEHLKLLYSIDMLNEGVHVDDIDGVILLRPTVSPIIYKQQIGRALSVGSKKNSVIFDIVLNIENLYSIGAVEDEMQIATAYYRSHGEDKNIVNEHFEIFDEVRDCRELFSKLNTTLTASWNLMYELAKQYFKANGNLEITKRYVTPDGYTLGSWVNTQRLVRAGKVNGKLTDKQIERLDRIGMRWDGIRDLSWEKNYLAAEKYYAENGNLLVNVNYGSPDGVKLGSWIAQLRNCKKSGINSSYLTAERIERLNKIGMVWDVPDYLWEKNYQAALNYFKENGNLNVPSYYRTEDGIRLGEWLLRLKRVYRGERGGSAELTAEQINRLNEIGISWNSKYDNAWENAYKAVCDYKKEYGNLDIPVAFVTEDGCRIGRWIRHQKEKYETLSLSRRKKLNAIGLNNKKSNPWEEKFGLLEKYKKEHGNLKIPADYVADGVWLARWLSEQRSRLNGRPTGRNKTVKKLTEEQEEKLISLGVVKKTANAGFIDNKSATGGKMYGEI